MVKRFLDWLDDRSGVCGFFHKLLYEPLPRNIGWWHVFGSGALFLFTLQFLTGILLAMNYVPSTREAYSSVMYITREIPFRKIVRGLHHWGASLMVIVVALHMLRVFLFGAYKKPRELTWIVGVSLFALVLGFAFTGYLLPYDQKAYWATKVGVNFAGYAPFVGDFIKRFLFGGDDIGAPTLTRFYAFHVLVLPALTVPLIALHIVLMRRKGIMPTGSELNGEDCVEKPLTFYPHQLWKDLCFAGLLLLTSFALVFHWGVVTEPPADPTDKNYLPRPEWYFLPLFQLQRLRIGGIAPFGGLRVWIGTVLIPTLLLLFLLTLPFLDRNPSRNLRKRPFALLGMVTLLTATVLLGVIAQRETESERRQLAKSQADTFTGMAAIGQKLVEARCLRCHRTDGMGKRKGPDFVRLQKGQKSPWTKEQLILFLANPADTYPKTEMPSARKMGLTTLDQISAIAEFLLHYKPLKKEMHPHEH